MKNKIFLLILSMFLLLPSPIWAEEDIVSNIENQTVSEEMQPAQSLDEDVESVTENLSGENSQIAIPYKQPISKKRLVKKFLIAMLAVAGSSFALYFGLTIYNRVRDAVTVISKQTDKNTPLQTPNDLESAVQTFLEKTHWD